jgi:gliding motility-associated-like protein
MYKYFKNLTHSILFLILMLSFKIGHMQVVINEYMCSNVSFHTDNFGQYEDWFELYNTSPTPVDISGYFLSDKINNPTKWEIPNVIIPGNGHVVFYASGKNTVVGNSYHTNFGLTQSKPNEYIVLSDNSGNIIDSVILKPALINHSRGRTTSGALIWGVFTTPTPNTTNSNAYVDYMPTPVMSLQSGFYTGNQSVTITSSDPTAVVRYTTNGAEPSATSAVYNSPLNINQNTVLRAKAFNTNPNYLPGYIETHSYFINTTHTLPVVSLSSGDFTSFFNGSSSINNKIRISCEYFDNAQNIQFKEYGEANPHGNDSWSFPQKGLDFIVRDSWGGYGFEMNYQIFKTSDREKFKRIMFKAGASDNYPFTWGNGGCHLRDAFIQSLAQKAKLDVDLRKYEACVLYVNGQYWGVYEVREKVNDPDYTSYYHNKQEEELDFLSYWGGLQVRYGSPTDWNNLYQYIMSNDMSVQANYNQVAGRLNIQSVIDYIIINTFTVNSDWINWNSMWWRGRNNPEVKWRYALWDMDAIFNLGHNYSGWPTTNYTANPCDLDNVFQNTGPNMGHLDIFNRLMNNEQFKSKYILRYNELINTYLSCPYMLNHLDSIVNLITPEMPQQISRWGGSINAWNNNLAFLRNQINGRCQVIEEGIVDCYDVTGPYTITVIVEPPMSGNVNIGGELLNSYPYTNTFFGDINTPLFAVPESGWMFSHWETNQHAVSPNEQSNPSTVFVQSNDTIIAHFTQTALFHQLVFRVEPPNTGTITIDGFTPAIYPFAMVSEESNEISLLASPIQDYHFSHWQLQHHSITPSTLNPNGTIITEHADTIIAYFSEDDKLLSITFQVIPPNSGRISVNNSFQVQTHQTEYFSKDENVIIQANGNETYRFSHWESEQHILLPNTDAKDVQFETQVNDIITAFFEMEDMLTIPNSFTPNNDGLNDFFYINFPEYINTCEINIYSRWGNLVFSSNNLQFKWDGTYLGALCPIGTYVYVLTYEIKESEIRKSISGAVTLIR